MRINLATGWRYTPIHDRQRLKALHGQSEKAIFETPALREFVNRKDVKCIRAPIGTHHVFVDNESGHHWYFGDTLLEAVEKALKEGF